MQWQPFLGRVSGEVVLREVGPVVRRLGIRIDKGHGATVRLPAQHLRTRISSRAGANDHHRFRSANRNLFEQDVVGCARRSGAMTLAFQLSGIALACNAHNVVLDSYVVRRQIVQRRCARRSAIVQLETGVMPWAADRFADQNTLMERCSVVRAFAANGEPVRLDVNQQDGLSKSVTGDELTRTYSADLDALSEVGPDQLIGMFCHSFP